mmetsp:Transcript_19771/g.50177  ORF Transcript_19771/g.50177 Transcript_19771/m.50177 type:complete len:1447 (-) Transcript_19771:1231-5571(-)
MSFVRSFTASVAKVEQSGLQSLRGRVQDVFNREEWPRDSVEKHMDFFKQMTFSGDDEKTRSTLLTELRELNLFEDSRLIVEVEEDLFWGAASWAGDGQVGSVADVLFGMHCVKAWREEQADNHLSECRKKYFGNEVSVNSAHHIARVAEFLTLASRHRLVVTEKIVDDVMRFLPEADPESSCIDQIWVDDVERAVIMFFALCHAEAHCGEPYSKTWGDYVSDGLHRQRFAERLILESNLNSGLLRLVNLWVLFLFLFLALDTSQQRTKAIDIRDSLVNSFELETLKDTVSMSAFRSFLENFQRAAQAYAPLSSQYFLNDKAVKLTTDMEALDGPKSLSGHVGEQKDTLSLPIVSEFSFTAWVQIDTGPFPVDGENDRYVIRKIRQAAGAGANDTCWGWKANSRLEFGSHDFEGSFSAGQGQMVFPSSLDWTVPRSIGNHLLKWEDLQPGAPNSPAPAAETLIGVAVRGNEVEFFVAGGSAGAARPCPEGGGGDTVCVTYSSSEFTVNQEPLRLPRAVTDCPRQFLNYGDAGITMGDLRYYPMALSVFDIDVIYAQGVWDKDIGSNIRVDKFEVDDMALFQSDLRVTQEETTQEVSRVTAATLADQLTLSVAVLSVSGGSLPAMLGSSTAVLSRDSLADLDAQVVQHEAASVPAEVTDVVLPTAVDASTAGAATFSGWVLPGGELQLTWLAGGDRCLGVALREAGVAVSLGSQQTTMKSTANPDLKPGRWRHIAVSVGGVESCSSCIVGVFLDGVLLPMQQVATPAALPAACAAVDKVTLQSTVAVASSLQQAHMFAAALTPAAVQRIHTQSKTLSSPSKNLRRDGGCMTPEELQDDGKWRDHLGQGCDWYYDMLRDLKKTAVCELPGPRRYCPFGCASVPLCFSTEEPAADSHFEMQIFNRVMLLDPEIVSNEADGNTTSELTFQRTKSLVCIPDEAPPEMRENTNWWTLNPPQSTALPAQPMRVDTTCSAHFSSAEVAEFTRRHWESKEFSLYFWVRAPTAVIGKSLQSFAPEVMFWRREPEESRIANESNPLDVPLRFPFISFQTASTASGYFSPTLVLPYTNEECSSSLSEAADIIPFVGSTTEWMFFAMTRSKSGLLRSYLNGQMQQEPFPSEDCLSTFLDGISVNRKMLLSPIKMLTKALSPANMQHIYYTQRHKIANRPGPTMADPERQNYRETREVNRFTQRTMILAPPVLAQTIRRPALCRSELEDNVLQLLKSKARTARCPLNAFYFCPEVHTPEFQLFQCSDPTSGEVVLPPSGFEPGSKCNASVSDACYFGQFPDEEGWYREYLTSIVDNSRIVRDREYNTRDFINERTQTAQLNTVFHSPEYGLTTLLEITANIARAKVVCSYSVKPLFGLHEEAWNAYLVWQCSVALFVTIMFVDNIRIVVEESRAVRRLGRLRPGDGQKNFFYFIRRGLERGECSIAGMDDHEQGFVGRQAS